MENLFTDVEIHEAVGGRITKRNWSVKGVSIDSRTILKGELFIAIQAERDGHNFIISAIQNGAAAAIVTRIPKDLPSNFPCLLVKDSLKALNDLAHFSRQRYQGKLVAVTGSVGKTSTKAMLSQVFSKFGNTYSSPQSYNNYLGVPLTLVNIPLGTQYVVCEIGMNSRGEIEPLSKLASPDIGIITNISPAHLASFNSLEGIAEEKAMICSGLASNGILIYPNDTPYAKSIVKMINKKKVRKLTFGFKPAADVYLKKIGSKKNKTSLDVNIKHIKNFSFDLDALGSHHAVNSLTVLGTIFDLGLNLDKAVNYLRTWRPGDGRGKILDLKLKKGSKDLLIKVIDESYNCNPSSLKASLEVVKNLSFDFDKVWKGKPFQRIAILGDMLELGAQAKKFHKDIADLESMSCFDRVHCIGELMENLYCGLSHKIKGLSVRDPKDLLPHLLSTIQDRDVYVVKGSNSVGLSFIVAELCKLKGQII
mgnify:CR=1 FL=1